VCGYCGTWVIVVVVGNCYYADGRKRMDSFVGLACVVPTNIYSSTYIFIYVHVLGLHHFPFLEEWSCFPQAQAKEGPWHTEQRGHYPSFLCVFRRRSVLVRGDVLFTQIKSRKEMALPTTDV
jgi:hypothetical protein